MKHLTHATLEELYRGKPGLLAHSERVALAAELLAVKHEWLDASVYLTGLLHDVIEDTDLEFTDVVDLAGYDVASSVRVLTRLPEETYAHYIYRVEASGDEVARLVKLADLHDHLDQIETLKPTLAKRYVRALRNLTR